MTHPHVTFVFGHSTVCSLTRAVTHPRMCDGTLSSSLIARLSRTHMTYMCHVTHSLDFHDLVWYTCVLWHIHLCDVPHSWSHVSRTNSYAIHVWCEVTWRIHRLRPCISCELIPHIKYDPRKPTDNTTRVLFFFSFFTIRIHFFFSFSFSLYMHTYMSIHSNILRETIQISLFRSPLLSLLSPAGGLGLCTATQQRTRLHILRHTKYVKINMKICTYTCTYV